MSIKRSIVVGEKTKAKAPKQAVLQKEVVKTMPVIRNIKEVEIEPRVFKKEGPVLIIVESPAKSKTIEKFLGKGYAVKASMGHLRDLPKDQLAVDIENGFLPRYQMMHGRKKLIQELRSCADEASAILLATDPDREGEAISYHLAHILGLSYKDTNRITFNEITKHAVRDAITSPRVIDMHMVDAQQARRVLDRLVGYRLSPLLWKKVCKGLSAGRVQSIAVAIICDREREIIAFIPEEYWTLEVSFSGKDEAGKKQVLTTSCVQYQGNKLEIHNEQEAKDIAAKIEGKEGYISKVERRKRSRKPPAPFTTSTLQQEGVRKLGFGAKRTMMIAQHLYEGVDLGSMGSVGLITYMRTDSTRIAEEVQVEAKEYILHTYGQAYYPSKPNVYHKKNGAQDAHEAIRPTSMQLTPDFVASFLTKDELKLYTLIWNRFIASQMAAQQTESVSILVDVEEYQCKAVGSRVLFPGFTEVYDEAQKEKDTMLPNFTEGTSMEHVQTEKNQHFTQPPARYSEASLIKVLEEKGIGRPSTYAPILDTIMKRHYVERKEKQFVPTELGFTVVDFLREHFQSIMDINFTAHVEEALDEVGDGRATYTQVMEEFYASFSHDLSLAEDAEPVRVEEVSDEVCELCGSPMVYKFGMYGKFLACSNFPSCVNTKPIVETIGVPCPKCQEGEVVRRQSKRGRTFYGCSRYPSCDFVEWDKPIAEKCSVCGSYLLEKVYKNGTTKKYCANAACETRIKKMKKDV